MVKICRRKALGNHKNGLDKTKRKYHKRKIN
jgi:hypothetical protein